MYLLTKTRLKLWLSLNWSTFGWMVTNLPRVYVLKLKSKIILVES